MPAHTGLTLDHIRFRSKCDESRELTDYGPVSSKGPRLGSYELLAPLRDCQVGSAFVAVRPGVSGFEKRVALYCTQRERLERVAAEANLAARLSHAGVAHVLDVGVCGETCYVATEHLSGTTLRTMLLRRGRLPWRKIAPMISDAALGLAYAHGRRGEDGRLLGIIHGRVSPGRITLEPSGTGRVSGLGVSWAWPNDLGFGAPEEKRREPVDGRADVFALGTILGRCVTERELQGPVLRVIEHATQTRPEHRCTAAQMHEALTALLRDAEPVAAE